MRFLLCICAFFVMLSISSSVTAHDANGWVVVGDQSGLGFEVHRIIGDYGLQVWGLSEDLESPDPSVSERPVEADQLIVAAIREWDVAPSVSVGLGLGHVGYTETGFVTQVIDGAPRLVSLKLANESTISPVVTGRFAHVGDSIFADVQGLLSSEGLAWMARLGWRISSFWLGAGYHAGPGEDGVSAPLVFVRKAF